MRAIRVIYDEQQNKYYRVDRNTGEMIGSQKNGQLIKTFKPQYTGKDYHMRKEKQESFSPPSIINPPFKVKYTPSSLSKLNFSSDRVKHTQSVSKIKNTLSDFSNSEEQKKLQKYATIDSLFQTKLSHNNSNNFSNRLIQFTKIKQNKVKENNSPRRDIQGSQPVSKLLSQYDNKMINGLEFTKKKQFKPTNTMSLPDNLSAKKQLYKQKQTFLKYHPFFAPKENERQIKQLKDRKQNMKILQKLNLQQNDRITKNVYQ